jgi:hypothetical protein
MKTIYKYIQFDFVPPKPKTLVIRVRNKVSQIIIGYIYWYPQWRQYCFFPEAHTVYSKGCLSDIIDFIKQLMIDRKK